LSKPRLLVNIRRISNIQHSSSLTISTPESVGVDVPAYTSASSEHVESLFSTAGLILIGKRSSLTQDKLNMIVCIHDNFELIVAAAANDGGSLKLIDSATTPTIVRVTLSTKAARSTAAIVQDRHGN